MNITYKSGDYVSVPMTENLFWNRVGLLRNAMLTAEDFEFRLLYFHKLQELMKFVPWVLDFFFSGGNNKHLLFICSHVIGILTERI